jgi:D-alanyl-D-alanine dipeptidase
VASEILAQDGSKACKNRTDPGKFVQAMNDRPKTPLIEITARDGVALSLAYATAENFTGKPVYAHARCYLHPYAAELLYAAVALAKRFGHRLKIFDGFRPAEAQQTLWDACPDPEFLADPKKGSPHSRGIAIDLTLVDPTGKELDMGTPFDSFTPLSHHGNGGISLEASRNRLFLLGLMTDAGWDFYRNEWWHYQLFDAKRYPLLHDADFDLGMLGLST